VRQDLVEHLFLEVEVLVLVRLCASVNISVQSATEHTTYHALVLIVELPQDNLDFLSRNEYGILARYATLLAELFVDLSESDVR
jgi:hypothetical protein